MPSARERAPRPPACLNCGSTRVEAWCARCGQRNVDLRVPARDLALDAIEDGLSLDSRIGRTVVPFLFHPGRLTTEWCAGRRARYSSPLRLFLLTSAVFFLLAGLSGSLGTNFTVDDREGGAGPAGAAGAGGSTGAVLEVTGPGGEEAAHARLREHGWLGRAVDARWRAIEAMPREELRTRLDAAFREWIPRVVFFLVPAAVLVLALLWRGRWLSEHVVLALHLHAFAFAVFTVLVGLRALPWSGPRTVLGPVLLLSIPVHVAVALRRVHGEPWRRTLPKAAAAGLLYLLALGVGMAGVGLLALWLA